MCTISIIVAMNAARIIGNNGDLPWHLPTDLRRFREITKDCPVIMGRKTFESILRRNGEPLPNRRNIIITHEVDRWKKTRHDHLQIFKDCVFVSSLKAGIYLFEHDPQEVFIIGGAQIYEQALPIAHRIYLTQVQGVFEGDTKFPLCNMHEWITVDDAWITDDRHPYAFSILHRKKINAPLASTTTGTQLVNPAYATSAGYDKAIADIEQRNVCPFCPETFLWHPWPILHEYDDWIITRNGWPYENAKHHFLIIGKRHIDSVTKMCPADDMQVRILTKWAQSWFKLKGYGLLSRSGDTNYTGSSVQHLHFHLIQPKLDANGKALPVMFPIG